ncbi:MAG: RsmB/NOP family class I SAM-dependent RNA methyltransferase [Chlamydiae bacterium]|nr:RsmB/NOP family class I SAM-dependent RNA methyltransferase [Chlamydiota bacterium]
MKIPFRDHHIILILKNYEEQNNPLDVFLSNYFKNNKAIGSKDRSFICENIYTMIRYRALLDHLSSKPTSWEKRLEALQKHNLEKYKEDETIPLNIRVSFPKDYFELILNSALEKVKEFCQISNTPAPTTIRVNLLKISRDGLFDKLSQKFEIKKGIHSDTAIIFLKRINFFALEEFKEGLFEIQDEGSQLISSLVSPKEKDQILDYCAGAGGKTLAFAPSLKNQGQIYLHDVRDFALLQAKKRLKRAGIQNGQIKNSNELNLLKNKMDWVLLDVPCSGSGTLRRNPDMKWKFNKDSFLKLLDLQKEIFKNGLQYLKKEGFIVYTTCSILKEENENQVQYFINTYNLKLVKQTGWLPEENGMDGFFGAVFEFNK